MYLLRPNIVISSSFRSIVRLHTLYESIGIASYTFFGLTFCDRCCCCCSWTQPLFRAWKSTRLKWNGYDATALRTISRERRRSLNNKRVFIEPVTGLNVFIVGWNKCKQMRQILHFVSIVAHAHSEYAGSVTASPDDGSICRLHLCLRGHHLYTPRCLDWVDCLDCCEPIYGLRHLDSWYWNYCRCRLSLLKKQWKTHKPKRISRLRHTQTQFRFTLILMLTLLFASRIHYDGSVAFDSIFWISSWLSNRLANTDCHITVLGSFYSHWCTGHESAIFIIYSIRSTVTRYKWEIIWTKMIVLAKSNPFNL